MDSSRDWPLGHRLVPIILILCRGRSHPHPFSVHAVQSTEREKGEQNETKESGRAAAEREGHPAGGVPGSLAR
jgi:hypothetical protein